MLEMEGLKAPVTSEDQRKLEDASTFNLKWLVSTVLAIWPLLLVSISIALIAANLYLRYTTPIYKSFAEMLFIDSKKGSSSSGDDIMKMLNIFYKSFYID